MNKPSEQELDFDANHVKEYLDNMTARFSASRDSVAKQGNSTERALSSQLMLVTTVLVSGTILALNMSMPITTLQKYILFTTFVLLAASTFFGIKYYLINIKFYEDWSALNHKIVQYIESRDYRTESEFRSTIDGYNTEIGTDVPKTWLNRQILSIILTFAMYALLIIAIFFNFHFNQAVLPIQ